MSNTYGDPMPRSLQNQEKYEDHFLEQPLKQKDLIDSSMEVTGKVYKEYSYRFLVVFVFFISAIMNALPLATISPFQDYTQDLYDVGITEINFVSAILVITQVVFAIPGNYIMDKYGLKQALMFNGIFMIIGVWIRTLINYNFMFMIIGNGIAGIGLNIILTGAPQIAFHWFKPKNSPLVTAILMMGQPLGFVFAFWIPELLTDFNHDPIDLDHDKQQMFTMLYKEAIIITFGLIPCLVFYKNHPPTPPCAASQVDKMSYIKAFKVLCQIPDYKYQTYMVAGQYGLMLNMIVNINTYLNLFGFDQSRDLLLISAGVIAGTIGSIIAGIIVGEIQWEKKFKKMLIIYNISTTTSWFIFTASLWSGNFWVIFGTLFLLQFAQGPVTALSTEMACDTCFPIGEGLVAGVQQIAAALMGAMVMVVSSFFMESKESILVWHGIMTVFYLLCLVSSCLLKEDLARKKIENQSN